MDSIATENQARAGRYRELLSASPLLYAPAQQIPAGAGADAAIQYVLGPLLAEFVRWVLLSAWQSGQKRLYFLARDGYAMYEAAKICCGAFGLPVDCRYLSCSRYALRQPLFHTDHRWALETICTGGRAVTPERVLARAGLPEPERRIVLEQLDLPYGPNQALPPAALAELRRALSRCNGFLDQMDAHAAAALPALIQYLIQEGIVSGRTDAVVDSGWTGTIQETLTRVCTYAGRKHPLEGYYFGLYGLPRHVERARYRCYYFAPEGDIGRKAHFSSSLFEAVFTAPHGMTVGYRQTAGRYVPIYTGISEQALHRSRQILPQLIAFIRCFAAATDRTDFIHTPFDANRQILSRLIRLFMCTPTRAEAAFFGSIPFSDDVVAAGYPPLAAQLNARELRAWRLLRRHHLGGAVPPRESPWYPGSAVLYGRERLRNLSGYTRYQYARHLYNTCLYRKEHRP